MQKKLYINAHEQNIMDQAHAYSVCIGRSKVQFGSQEAAEKYAEEVAANQKRKALVYAIAEICGGGCSAMYASFCPKFGWNRGVLA